MGVYCEVIGKNVDMYYLYILNIKSLKDNTVDSNAFLFNELLNKCACMPACYRSHGLSFASNHHCIIMVGKSWKQGLQESKLGSSVVCVQVSICDSVHVRTGMHASVCACVHVYVNLCMCVHACICESVYVRVHACMHLYVHTYVHVYVHAYVNLCMCVCMCVCVCVCMCTCTCVCACVCVSVLALSC